MTDNFEEQVNDVFSTKEVDTEAEKADDGDIATEGGDDALQEESEGKLSDEETEEATESDESEEKEEKKTNADFIKERHKYKDIEEQNAYLKDLLSKVVGSNQQASSRPELQVPVVPEPEINPFDEEIETESYNLWNDVRETRKEGQQLQQSMQLQQIYNRKDTEEVKIAQNNPEYLEKKQFLIDKQAVFAEIQHAGELRVQYPNATDEQIKGFFKQQSKAKIDDILVQNIAKGGDLSQIVDSYAQGFGYDTLESKEEVGQQAPKIDLNKIKQNKKRSNNINGKGLTGEDTVGRRTSEQVAQGALADLLDMDGQEFAKIKYSS